MKKNTKLMIISMSIITTAIIYTACSKIDKDSAKSIKGLHLRMMSTKYNFKDFPTVENGMLNFRDDIQYTSYLQFLDDNIEAIDSTDTINDEHSILQDIEDGLSFSSLRKTTHETYEIQNRIGFSSLEAASDEHFIASADIRSTLNSDANVRIGNAILHYINKDFAIQVGIDNKELLEKYMLLGKGATLDDLWIVDQERRNSIIYELTGDNRIFSGKDFEPLGPNDKYLILPKYFIKNRCTNPYNVKFSDLHYVKGVNTRLNAYYKIQFGDNSPEISITGASHIVIDFYHDYPGPGTYTATIKACQNLSFLPNETQTKTMSVVVLGGQACAAVFKESGWQYLEYETNRYLGGRLEMQDYVSGSGAALRVLAYTKLVEQTSPGIYKGFKGNLTTTMHGEAKGADCSFNHYVDGSTTSKTKHQTLQRTPGYQATVGQSSSYWSHFTSSHKYSGHVVTINLYSCN